MSRVFSAQILRGPFIIIPQKCWKDSYGRNTPSEEVENMKNVKFDIIKILEGAERLCLVILVRGYLENLLLLSLKNFRGIAIGGTFLSGLKFQKMKILESAEGLCLRF